GQAGAPGADATRAVDGGAGEAGELLGHREVAVEHQGGGAAAGARVIGLVVDVRDGVLGGRGALVVADQPGPDGAGLGERAHPVTAGGHRSPTGPHRLALPRQHGVAEAGWQVEQAVGVAAQRAVPGPGAGRTGGRVGGEQGAGVPGEAEGEPGTSGTEQEVTARDGDSHAGHLIGVDGSVGVDGRGPAAWPFSVVDRSAERGRRRHLVRGRGVTDDRLTPMTPVLGLVLATAILHAGWNALAKSLGDRWVASDLIGTVNGLFGIGCILLFGLPAPGAWPFLVLSALLQAGYLMLLTKAYAHGDMS